MFVQRQERQDQATLLMTTAMKTAIFVVQQERLSINTQTPATPLATSVVMCVQ